MLDKNYNICILGLGYIGLPTATLFAKNGFNVIGVDINSEIVDKISLGISPIIEPGLSELIKFVVENNKFKATTDYKKAIKESNIIIVIVPTPIDENKKSDLNAVVSACEMISSELKKDDIIIIESTVPPGTCDNVIIPLLEKNGLNAGYDFKIAYTPERALPRNTLYEMTHNARVVGGIDSETNNIVAKIYQKITKGEIICVENLITAEMIKLMENTYRDVNIALANEITKVCEQLNIDAITAINAANYHPRVNIHSPGPGVGGHCLSIDPYFIIETVENTKNPAKLIKTAREINENMPLYVSNKVKTLFKKHNKLLKNSKISILGVAYKANVDDIRETPAIPLIIDLKNNGCNVVANDPYVSDEKIKSIGAIPVSIDEALKADCVILITDHDEYKTLNPKQFKNNMFVCARPILNPADFRKENVIFIGVGRI